MSDEVDEDYDFILRTKRGKEFYVWFDGSQKIPFHAQMCGEIGHMTHGRNLLDLLAMMDDLTRYVDEVDK